MKDFENAVAVATREAIASGLLKEIVGKTVRKSITGIVEEVLSSYSPFGKQLKESLAAELCIDPGKLGLAGYNQTVLAIIRQKLDHAINEVATKKLAADLEEMLGDAAPKEIRLSELVKQFKQWVAERAARAPGEHSCTIILEPSEYSSRFLYLDPKKGSAKYACEFSMLIGKEDGAVSCCRIGGIDTKKDLFAGVLYGFPRTFFQMYAAGTKVLIDQEEFDCRLDRDEDEDKD
jgi:hypothetical protein